MASASRNIPGECPYPDELGQAGWTILHTAAAVFPNTPTPGQVSHFQNFLTSWANVYACSHCAFHMRQMLQKTPPAVVRDKRSASRYVCELHNEVNAMLQKPVYDCDPDVVLQRWHPTYTDMTDTPTPEEQLQLPPPPPPPPAQAAPRKWQSWQDGGGASASASPAASSSSSVGGSASAGGGGGGGIADNEKDSALVMARLKACQVYCPDKDKKPGAAAK